MQIRDRFKKCSFIWKWNCVHCRKGFTVHITLLPSPPHVTNYYFECNWFVERFYAAKCYPVGSQRARTSVKIWNRWDVHCVLVFEHAGAIETGHWNADAMLRLGANKGQKMAQSSNQRPLRFADQITPNRDIAYYATGVGRIAKGGLNALARHRPTGDYGQAITPICVK